MTDNVNISAGTGTPVATDDIGGVQYQRVKIGIGPDGSATDWSSAAPAPVSPLYVASGVSVVNGTKTATGRSSTFTPTLLGRPFNVAVLTNTSFVATLQIEKSYDTGSNWQPLTSLGSSVTFSGPFTELCVEYESGVQYCINVTAYTSGTVTYRFSA